MVLGTLSLVSPFAVDMYLPAFARVAAQFHTNTAAISLSLSSYFIGFALGQVFYGPLLDRFGRKPPLTAGLILYIAASLGCIHPHDLNTLVALRFVQALGGCVAQVAAVAMVRDFFPPEQSARVFSLVFLVIGVSPLLAPSIGSLVMISLGWQWIFVLLALFAAAILTVVLLFLAEPHTPDRGISLHPAQLLRTYLHVWKQPQFVTYGIAGAFSFSGLFSYVAGSPILFMDGYHVSAQTFGAIFAVLTGGFIAGSQLNVFLLRRFTSSRIFSIALDRAGGHRDPVRRGHRVTQVDDGAGARSLLRISILYRTHLPECRCNCTRAVLAQCRKRIRSARVRADGHGSDHVDGHRSVWCESRYSVAGRHRPDLRPSASDWQAIRSGNVDRGRRERCAGGDALRLDHRIFMDALE